MPDVFALAVKKATLLSLLTLRKNIHFVITNRRHKNTNGHAAGQAR
jgi:hypothetical protein